MKLKKKYDQKGLISHVEILTAGPIQRFSPRLVDKALMEGWMLMENNTITIQSKSKDVNYLIVRYPGIYCCHCGEQLADGGRVANEHVESRHAGIVSPDLSNLAGFRYDNFYECNKEV